MHKRIMQRNNLVIFQINELYQEDNTPRFSVETLDHRVLEQFVLLATAICFCRDTPDFIKSKQERIKTE